MIEDKDFDKNVTFYKEWLLSPTSLKNNKKSYLNICENIVDKIIKVLYDFHYKISNNKKKISLQALILAGLVGSLAGYGLYSSFGSFYQNTINVYENLKYINATEMLQVAKQQLDRLVLEGVFTGLTVGTAVGFGYYQGGKISKEDMNEIKKIKNLFDDYVICVLEI